MEPRNFILSVIVCLSSVILTIPPGLVNSASTPGPNTCVDGFGYEVHRDRNANGATRYTPADTLLECQERCSDVSNCRSLDFNTINDQCWIHTSNVEGNLQRADDVDHYERVPCTDSSDATDPQDNACVDGYGYELHEDRNANGASRYTAADTLLECQERCSDVSNCRSLDFNTINDECWIHTSNVEGNLQRADDVDHYERVDCTESSTVKSSTAKTTPEPIPECVGNSRYFEYEDEYATGGTKQSSTYNTLLKCLQRCSSRSRTQCTAIDFNSDKECFLHTTPADEIDRSDGNSGTVSHFVRYPCDLHDECIHGSEYEKMANSYALGAELHESADTLLRCQLHCSDLDYDDCRSFDFNDDDECWIHTDDDPDILDSDDNSVDHYVRELCDRSTSSGTSAKPTTAHPNLAVEFTMYFTNNYDSTISDKPDFIDTVRDEWCRVTGVRCSRLTKPKNLEDVYEVEVKENPGPAKGSIVVEGYLLPAANGSETDTETVMEDFEDDFRNFRPRLSSENNRIRLRPDTSTSYDGFFWERVPTTSPPEEDDGSGLETEFWVLIILGAIALIIAVIAIIAIVCLRRKNSDSSNSQNEKKEKIAAEKERIKRQKEEKKRAEEERKARAKEEKKQREEEKRREKERDVEKAEEDAYTEPDVVPKEEEPIDRGLSDDDKAY